MTTTGPPDVAHLRLQLVPGQRLHSTLSCGDVLVEDQSTDAVSVDSLPSFRHYERLEPLIAGDPPASKLEEYRVHERETAERVHALAFPGDVSSEFSRIRRELRRTQAHSLLLQVTVSPTWLEGVAWELLGRHDNGEELLVWRSAPVILSGSSAWPTRRLLAISSCPLKGQPPNAHGEMQAIEAELLGVGRRDIEHRPLPDVTLLDFHSELAAFRPSVLHLAMHADEQGLYFRSEKEDELRENDKLAVDLRQVEDLSTVILTACRTGYIESHGPSLIRKLGERGLSAVVGMACDTTPAASQDLTRALYRELYLGSDIVRAFAAGVRAIRNMRELPDTYFWSVPVLYASHNVIPFPTDEDIRLLDQLDKAIHDLDVLSLELRSLPVTPGLSSPEWRGISTGASMAKEPAGRALHHLSQIAEDARAGPGWWRDRLKDASASAQKNLRNVEKAVWQLSTDGLTDNKRIEQADTLQTTKSTLQECLQGIHDLVTSRFPMVPRERVASRI